MPNPLFTYRKILMICPLIFMGFCFQNFSELEVPTLFPDIQKPVSATSVEGAAEELLRREMPEIGRLENKLSEKLQFRWVDDSAGPVGEVQLGLLESASTSPSVDKGMKLSLVNDRFRLDFASVDMTCDYSPVRDVVSVRSNASAANHFVIEHSARDQQSRVNWQMNW